MRKISIPIVILLVLIILIGLGWFLMQRESRSYTENSAFKAIPLKTPLVIEVTDVQRLLGRLDEEGPLMSALREIPELQSFRASVDGFKTLVGQHEGLNESLKKPVLIAFNPEGKDEIGCLFALSLENRAEKSEMISFISDYANKEAAKLTKRIYDDVEIYRYRKGETDYHFAESNGIFLLSRHALFVEEAVRQIPVGNLLDQQQFKDLYNTIGRNSDFNVFIYHEKINQLLSKAVSPQFKAALPLFAHFADRTELDVSLKSTDALLGGFSFSDKASHNYLNAFRNQEPDRFGLGKMIPSGVGSFLCLNISDFEKYQHDYNEFLKGKPGNYYRRETGLKALEPYCGKPLVPRFQQMAGKEFALVFGQVTQNEPAANRFFIAGVKSQSMARELLMPMLEKYAGGKKTSISKMQSVYRIQDNKSVTIYEFPFGNFPALLMGEAFSAVESNYLCFYDDYLIFADNLTALKNYIHDLILSDTLENNVHFDEFNRQMASKFTFYFYLNFPRAFYLKNYYLNETVSKAVQENEEAIRKFYGFGWQFSASSGEFLNNLYLKYDPVLKEEPQIIWQTRLDSTLSVKPQLVINHYDKANMEVLVQDNKNKLYLINKEGATLWKHDLPGKIMSEIYQVDYYRNGKLQYFFNTRDHLHLIDRNGNKVARFPVKLRAPSTNGVAVFDYDRNRDYRYFVASDDRKIDAYDRDGRIVSGWKFEETEGMVSHPLKYFRQGTKDFLVCADEYKTYILDRQGNIRVNTDENVEHSDNDLYISEDASPAVITTDTGGKVYLEYFDGKTATVDLGTFGEGHFFRADDLNGDKKTDYVLAEDQVLMAFTDQGKKIFERKFNSPITAVPAVYTFGPASKKIGVVCAGENRIYLVDTKGQLYPGFPLPGSTSFTIGYLTSGNPYFNLLTGNEDNSFFNYKIE